MSANITRGQTASGSRYTIDATVDKYGRCSSHVITGYRPTKDGYLSGYYTRNVSAKDVVRLVKQAEAEGWKHVAASIESF